MERHRGNIMVAKHKIVLNLPNAPTIHPLPYRAGTKQRKLGRAEIAQIEIAGVAEPAVTK